MSPFFRTALLSLLALSPALALAEADDGAAAAAPVQEPDLPALSAVSSIPGVELPQIRYQAPAKP